MRASASGPRRAAPGRRTERLFQEVRIRDPATEGGRGARYTSDPGPDHPPGARFGSRDGLPRCEEPVEDDAGQVGCVTAEYPRRP